VKLILPLILTLASISLFGQENLLIDNSLPIQGIWQYKDLREKKITKVECFSFLDSQKDSAIKDTILFFKQDIDINNNTLSTSIFVAPLRHIELHLPYTTRGNIKEYYNKSGLQQKQVLSPIDTTFIVENSKIYLESEYQIDTLLYDSNNMLTEEIHKKFNDKSKKRNRQQVNDTCLIRSIETGRFRYTYNDKQQLLRIYYFKDSVRYKDCSPINRKPYCNSCNAEYLKGDFFYDETNNTTTCTGYEKNGELSSKFITHRSGTLIIQRIDTIYLPSPDRDMITKMEENFYRDSLMTKQVITEKRDGIESKNIITYNRFGHPIKSYLYFPSRDSSVYHETYEYIYDSDKISSVKKTGKNDIYEEKYSYDKQGLVIEEKHLQNGTVSLWKIYRYTYSQ
jgi:hypothetical protein